MKETLGEGAFGVVGKCINKTSGAVRAVKMLSKSQISKDQLKDIANEIAIIKELDHPNIVKIYEEYEDHKYLYIVTELIEGGELFDELINRSKFTEADCATIVSQLLEALSYCHSKSIVHKDLKPENILLEKKKNIDTIKLIDFGTAQKFNPDKKMTTVIGTPYYIAPEVLKGSYDEKCDIWGAGVIMFILLSGVPPFNGPDDNAIMKKVASGKFKFNPAKWKGISKSAKDLIEQMLIKEPENRITAQEALEHKWMKNYKSGTINKKDLSNALNGLKKHHAEQTMQQATLAFIATQLTTKEDTKHLDDAFKMLDADHDGKLSLDELLQGFKQVLPEMTEDEARKLFERADIDNSGFIDYSEWISATINKKKILSNKNLTAAFNLFDEDDSGTISMDEIKKILGQNQKIQEDVWENIVAEIDENDDDEIDFDEFKDMMHKFVK